LVGVLQRLIVAVIPRSVSQMSVAIVSLLASTSAAVILVTKTFLATVSVSLASPLPTYSTVCGKKVSAKVVCRFLSNHLDFFREI